MCFRNKSENSIPIQWPDGTETYLNPIKCGTGLLKKQRMETIKALEQIEKTEDKR